jgi:hypothetical protein
MAIAEDGRIRPVVVEPNPLEPRCFAHRSVQPGTSAEIERKAFGAVRARKIGQHFPT